MRIAGFQKMTLLDYPDKIAALIFTQGCNFACGYCHNPEMIPKIRILSEIREQDPEWILAFLKTRRGMLDGVVISGGEPTLQEDLAEYMEKIKSMGFLIKLDTNGSRPEVLKTLLSQNLIDFIAMDLKATGTKYQELVKNSCEEQITQSISLIMNGGVEYEFRSTILPFCHSVQDIETMGKMIQGSKRWYLQNFRPIKTLSRIFEQQRSFTQKELEELASIGKKYVQQVGIRN